MVMHVFISYSRSHLFIAETVKELLEENNFRVWIDLEGIPSGELWESTIESAIHNSFAVIVLVTEPSLKSQPIRREIEIALHSGKYIIPCLMERFHNDADALATLGLSERQAISFFSLGKNVAESRLISDLGKKYSREAQVSSVLGGDPVFKCRGEKEGC